MDYPSLYFQADNKRKNLLFNELNFAIKQTSQEEIVAWGQRTIEIMFKATIRRGKNLASLALKIASTFQTEAAGIISAALKGNLIEYIKKRGNEVADITKEATQNLVNIIKHCSMALRSKPKETAPKIAAGTLGFLFGSGGVDGDGGIPDLDLIGGIGAHRSIFTHSIIIGVIFETIIYGTLDLIKTVYKNLPEKHDHLWEEFVYQSDGLMNALSSGLSAGIAYHLSIDATLDGGGTFKDLPIPVSDEIHKAILGANAAAEAIDVLKKTPKKVNFPVFSPDMVCQSFSEAAAIAKKHSGSKIVRASGRHGFKIIGKSYKA